MDFTDQHLAENLAAFEANQDPASIYQALELIEASERDIHIGDTAARQRAVERRLRFFAALDRAIDPSWNPENLPVRGAAPPPTDGIVYSSGEVDPATISDPAVRADYERALQASKDYERWYDAQFQLRQIDDRAMRFFALFLSEKYTHSAADRQEFEALLAASPVNPVRKERLRAIAP